MRAIGLMSGTSADGIDAVVLELRSIEQPHEPRVVDHAYLEFDAQLQGQLCDPQRLGAPELAALNVELAHLYAQSAKRLRNWQQAEVVGMPGQTVWHAPPSNSLATACTLQLGSSATLATLLELPVVSDLRSADIARGGEGAPIVPFAHWFFAAREQQVRLIVNVGGIANYTRVCTALENIRASDLGPGMMITDALVRHFTQGARAFDRDGELSQRGVVQTAVVEFILAHPFFARPLPRTTGREDFGTEFVARLLTRFRDVDGHDLIASSIGATADAIASAVEPGLDEVVLTGGGARNPSLCRALSQRVRIPLRVPEHGPFAPSIHEPASIALIAARTLNRLPSSVPHVTGARSASILGHVCWP